MKLLAVTAVLISISNLTGLPFFLANLGIQAQIICQEMTPNLSTARASIESLVCGKKVSDPEIFLALQGTGLIHIFVVSAGQLVVISEFLIFLEASRGILFFALVGFTIMTGLQAPCVRSLISWGFVFFLKRQKLFLTGPQTVLLSGLLTLALFPDWCQSFSLQLSWAAALALTMASTFKNKNHSKVQHLIATSIWVFVILLPLLQSFGGVHPLSILWNVTLGTITAFFLFPLCILAFLNPFCLLILEKVMKLFWMLLGLNHEFQTQNQLQSPSYVGGWLWILILHLILHITGIFYQRIYKT